MAGKFYLLFVVYCMVYGLYAQAQTYQNSYAQFRCEVQITASTSKSLWADHCRSKNYIELFSKMQNSETNQGKKNTFAGETVYRWEFLITPQSADDNRLSLYTYTKRRYGNSCRKGSDGNGTTVNIELPYSSVYVITESLEFMSGKFSSVGTICVYPYSFRLFNEKGFSSGEMLPQVTPVTYKVNKNLASASFSWYYQVGEGGTPVRFPDALCNSSRSSITFCGTDIKDDFVKAINENKLIYIYATADWKGRSSPKIVLTPQREAPYIDKSRIKQVSPVCAGEASGRVEIPFKESLKTGETLSLYVSGKNPVTLKEYYESRTLSMQESGVVFSGLPAGEYTLKYIEAIDSGGNPCYINNKEYHEYTFELSDPPGLTFAPSAGVGVHCRGGSDGKLCFSTGGGTGQLYLFCNGVRHSVASGSRVELAGFAAGEYRVNLRDEKGCMLKDGENKEKFWNLKVEEPVTPVRVQMQQSTLPTGYGRSDGEIRVIASGGSGSGYTYIWEREGKVLDGNTSMHGGLCAGSYRIRTRDGNYGQAVPQTDKNVAGCTGYTDVVLGQPPLLTATVRKERDISCNGYADGVLKAVAEGGVGGYSYQWQVMDGGHWRDETGRSAALNVVDGLKTGVYRVLVWDSNDNYAASESFRLAEPAPYSVDFKLTQPLCHGGTDGMVEAVVSGNNGGYFYQWQGTPVVVPVISGGIGIYTLTVTDKLGCKVTKEVELDEPPVLEVAYSVLRPSSAWAADGEILLYPSGGTPCEDGSYRYEWDYGHATVNPLTGIPADSVPYHVMVRDAHGCEEELAVWLIYPLEVSVRVKDSVSCSGRSDGTLEAVACGGIGVNYRLDWYRVEEGGLTYISSGKTCGELPGGVYRVKATDKSGGEAWSADCLFEQPGGLRVVVGTEAVKCHGGSDGKAMAYVSGGTLPYRYQWTCGDRTSEVSGLESGRYLVMVTDAHQCLAEAVGEVESPERLTVGHEVSGLLCRGNRVEVQVEAEGGVMPYRVVWNDGFSGMQRSDMPAGVYSVVVTDENGCRQEEGIVLEELEEVVVDLGGDLTLCRGQEKKLNVECEWDIADYRWFRDGRRVGSSSVLEVREEGLYRLEVTTEEGCPGSGALRVFESDEEVDCNFAMASEVDAGDVLKLVNTCLPVPEYSVWILPESASVQVVSDAQEMAELIFQRPGVYRIGLRAVVGACEEVLYKDLRVRQDGTERPVSRTTDRVIGGVSVWPNPNDGRFRVRVNLNEQADGVLRIYTSAGVLLREIKCFGEVTYELGFNESLPTGIYIIHLIFKDEFETVKIAVNK